MQLKLTKQDHYIMICVLNIMLIGNCERILLNRDWSRPKSTLRMHSFYSELLIAVINIKETDARKDPLFLHEEYPKTNEKRLISKTNTYFSKFSINWLTTPNMMPLANNSWSHICLLHWSPVFGPWDSVSMTMLSWFSIFCSPLNVVLFT